jgi:3-hydroxybutyryl-CoA dehydrogenase
MKAAVAGAGTMGRGIAQVLATAGIEVVLVDVAQSQLDRARSTMERSLARLEEKGSVEAGTRERALGLVHTTTRLEDASDAEVLVEAVVETLEAKRAIFTAAASVLSDSALLVSNTSIISITALAAAATQPQRVAGMHFYNPVPIMALVEVVRGQFTSDDTVEQVVALAKRLGKTPVVVNDYPGFVSNRILLPMLNEAFYALMEGVAEKEAIDQVMKLGMNHPMGPLQLADFIGLDVCLHILEVLHRDLGDDKYRPCPLLRRLVAAGRLGRKTGGAVYDNS